MVARTTRRRRFTAGNEGSCNQPLTRIEPLEGRTLLSFTTVDVVPTGENSSGVAADGAGNVYVAGDDQNGYYLRQGSNGGTTWANILTFPYPSTGLGQSIEGVGASPAGDVYVAVSGSAGGWGILERPAGTTQFTQVFSTSSPTGPLGTNFLSGDAAGNVYFITENDVTVTSRGKTTKQGYTQVWRRQGATGTFSLVDTSPASEFLSAISATPQGIYEVGHLATATGNTGVQHWIVRKSLTGDPGTWSTVDDFQYDAADNLSSLAQAITIDPSGNVLVGGIGTKKVRISGKYTNVQYTLVRKSQNGGATWTTDQVDSDAQLNGIGTDAAGNEYVAETKSIGGGSNASVVSMKPAGGTAWSIVDQIGVQGQSARAYGFTVDSNNNLYVAGAASDSVQGSYAFVRSTPGAPPPASSAQVAAPFFGTSTPRAPQTPFIALTSDTNTRHELPGDARLADKLLA